MTVLRSFRYSLGTERIKWSINDLVVSVASGLLESKGSSG